MKGIVFLVFAVLLTLCVGGCCRPRTSARKPCRYADRKRLSGVGLLAAKW